MDGQDGVCGTCKCRAEAGRYGLGNDCIDEALTQDEADEGLVLTCRMIPRSDCVISVAMPSTACKTGTAQFGASVSDVTPFGDAAYELVVEISAEAPVFLPGQTVNIDVPGSGQHGSYSFSSAPGDKRMTFMTKQVPGGLMSGWLGGAPAGQPVQLSGPLGSLATRRHSGRLETPRTSDARRGPGACWATAVFTSKWTCGSVHLTSHDSRRSPDSG